MNELQSALTSLSQVINALAYLDISHQPVATSIHDLMVASAKQDARRIVELLEGMSTPI